MVQSRLFIHGKRRELGLGPVRLVTLAQVREAARANRRLARAGGDPMAGAPPPVWTTWIGRAQASACGSLLGSLETVIQQPAKPSVSGVMRLVACDLDLILRATRLGQIVSGL